MNPAHSTREDLAVHIVDLESAPHWKARTPGIRVTCTCGMSHTCYSDSWDEVNDRATHLANRHRDIHMNTDPRELSFTRYVMGECSPDPLDPTR